MVKYDNSSIDTLRFPDNIRHNVSMYLGSSDEHGRWLIARELLDNGLDEFLAGRNKGCIFYECKDGSYWVIDYGAGIPQGIKTFDINVNGKVIKNKMPTMQAIFSEMHTSGKFRSDAYKNSIGCFTGDVHVQLNNCYVTMENLYNRWMDGERDFYLRSINPENGKDFCNDRVTHVQLSKYTKDLVCLEIDGYNKITCTPDHPFYTEALTKVKAEDLKVGDYLYDTTFKDKCCPKVTNIIRMSLAVPVPVYGITVETNHTYMIEDGYLVGNTHGVGAKGTNATSSFFDVYTCFKNKWYSIKFEKGILKDSVKEIRAPKGPNGKPLTRGTAIHFKPDATIFDKKSSINLNFVHQWAEITSYLSPGFTCLICEKNGKKTKYYSKLGATEYVDKLLSQIKAQAEKIRFEYYSDICDVVVAFSNCEGLQIRGYTNGLLNSQGGKHVDSLCSALLNALKDYQKRNQSLSIYDIKEGLLGVCNIKLHKAEFSSQDKARLTDNRAGVDFQNILIEEFRKFFRKNKALAQRLCEKATKLSDLRSQFKASKKVVQALNNVKKKGMPAKYAPADSRTKVCDRELFIVEGQSAGDNLRKKRKPYQSLYPIRGKIISALKTGDKVLESEEVIGILGALGFDPKAKNPLDKLLVGKVICLADPDPDGPLDANTKVLLCDGTIKTIKSLAKQWEKDHKPIWVWSLDKAGNIHPAQAINPRVTCYKEKYALVTFDDGTKIKCTLNHKFAVNYSSKKAIVDKHDIKYLSAKDLRTGDSIMSSYFEKTDSQGEGRNKNYISVIKDGKHPLHKIVAKDIYPSKYKKYVKSNKGVVGGAIHIHHKDENTINNTPENLTFLKRRAHYALHGSMFANKYNGSEKHLSDLAKFRKTKAGKENTELARQNFITYNKSKAHRSTVAMMNKFNSYQDLQRLGKVARIYLGMKDLNIPYTEENFNSLALVSDSGKKYNMPVTFESNVSLIEKFIKAKELTLNDGYTLCDKSDVDLSYPTQKISKFVYYAYEVYKKYKRLDKELYSKQRSLDIANKKIAQGTPKWDTIVSHLECDNITDFVLSSVNNHKVISVEIQECKETPFYCLTVPEYGNFLIADKNGNGICSSNCHINSLLLALFYKYMPQLFAKGMVYVMDVPELYAQYKGHLILGDTISEVQQKLKKLKAPASTSIHHIKGWGEIDPALMYALACENETRRLIRIKPIESRDHVDFVKCMNDDVAFRRKMLNLPE